ncbi:MAG: hypothetical protein NVS9B10_07000 [Nevskia sp.]
MDFPFTASTAQTARLVVEADFDPQFPARVLQRFSELNTLPLSFHAVTVGAAEALRIELEFEASVDAARRLSKRLLNLPSARSVDLSFRRLAAIPPQRRAA